jgi:hypothetical protein
MRTTLRAWIERLPIATALAAALALSLPGVEAARAGEDLAPSADELFRLNPRAQQLPAPASACKPMDPAQQRALAQRQAEIHARMAALLAAPAGGQVLNNRGRNYPTERNPLTEMAQIQAEAARAREAQRAN